MSGIGYVGSCGIAPVALNSPLPILRQDLARSVECTLSPVVRARVGAIVIYSYPRSHALRGNAVFDALRRAGLGPSRARRRRASKTAFPRRAWERDSSLHLLVYACCHSQNGIAVAQKPSDGAHVVFLFFIMECGAFPPLLFSVFASMAKTEKQKRRKSAALHNENKKQQKQGGFIADTIHRRAPEGSALQLYK